MTPRLIPRILTQSTRPSFASRASLTNVVPRRTYATEPPPHYPARREPSRAGTFYKSFGSPILKCFLGALFTYQVAYWAWMKLESLEERVDKEDEIEDLKKELKALVIEKIEAEKLLAEQEGATEQGKEKEGQKKKGWFW